MSIGDSNKYEEDYSFLDSTIGSSQPSEQGGSEETEVPISIEGRKV